MPVVGILSMVPVIRAAPAAELVKATRRRRTLAINCDVRRDAVKSIGDPGLATRQTSAIPATTVVNSLVIAAVNQSSDRNCGGRSPDTTAHRRTAKAARRAAAKVARHVKVEIAARVAVTVARRAEISIAKFPTTNLTNHQLHRTKHQRLSCFPRHRLKLNKKLIRLPASCRHKASHLGYPSRFVRLAFRSEPITLRQQAWL